MSAAPGADATSHTLLAFDFGRKRIGVAVGQSVTGTAAPLATVRIKGRIPDWDAIARLVEEWRPAAFVVGLPLDLDGGEQPMTTLSRRFGRQLEGRYRRPVHLVDERFSTREAHARMASIGARDGDDDPWAAQVILEGWFGRETSG